MSSDNVAIRVNNLSKCYYIYDRPQDRLKQSIIPRIQRLLGMEPKNYFREFWALRNVSFEVKKGETVGIIGRNGSGKSTLLQIICGTLTPTSGTVETNGRIAALLELGSGFNPEFTGRENVYLNGAVLGLSKEEIDARFDDIVSFADIGDFIDQPVKTYSSGMYVRLAFAVQACIDPDILIVDEALAVGDEKFQRKCFDRIEHLRSNGASILLVTHSTTVIERFCQRAVLLHNGNLHGVGPSNIIVDQYHALLYADEKAYLQILNRERRVAVEPNTESHHPANQVGAKASEDNKFEDEGKLRAQIVSYSITDLSGCHREIFQPGETVLVNMTINCFEAIGEIQAGISIKTVEGVPCFGTSTLYFGNNCKGVKPGEIVLVRFRLSLSLCEGVYFVSLAIAEPVLQGDMQYLDKRSDAIIFKVSEPRLKATGIAYLPATVEIIRGGIR
ncbi:ABC transporter ATP-binding protein [Desulfofundulus thermocisternus]|uniref:ABC transporter ATP-binding protein n=1 Tax=Desulfofundulus thermocisternus TaxID=42471 RepID=UPI0004854234|nr:ABC transporter ATP-binding protein [Desulfofundulus thermocisternus]